LIEIPDTDMGEPIKLRFRKLNPIEHDRMVVLLKEIVVPDKAADATKGIHAILGAKSMDDLDAAFWILEWSTPQMSGIKLF